MFEFRIPDRKTAMKYFRNLHGLITQGAAMILSVSQICITTKRKVMKISCINVALRSQTF